MSRIRPWANGDQVALDEGQVPVTMADRDVNVTNTVPVTMADRDVNVTNTVSTLLQDQITGTIIAPLTEPAATTTLAVSTGLYDKTLTVTSSTGFTVGHHIRIIDPSIDRFFYAHITGVSGNTISVNVPIDAYYTSGSRVITANENMAVNGSATPVVFKLRHGAPSIPSLVDITRLIIQCATVDPATLDLFGDLPALANGVLVRRNDGYRADNIFYARSNLDISGLCYDFVNYDAAKKGTHGFAARVTFAGQDKMGVALRIVPTGNLEVIIQDDLTGLTSLRVMAEGHVTNG